jgi:hypothetical protein
MLDVTQSHLAGVLERLDSLDDPVLRGLSDEQVYELLHNTGLVAGEISTSEFSGVIEEFLGWMSNERGIAR